ncbi:unnamed protein product [Pseudo-nitzschia multistriata]|uniref:PDZ domain-containing protein n=1 Tax=Pseudo-nitzschia multistriata TaxID=183589 RepID=A0A448Z074_9STRA|nr:unnamed protein product [Pseudo-nitzschia multistriata]
MRLFLNSGHVVNACVTKSTPSQPVGLALEKIKTPSPTGWGEMKILRVSKLSKKSIFRNSSVPVHVGDRVLEVNGIPVNDRKKFPNGVKDINELIRQTESVLQITLWKEDDVSCGGEAKPMVKTVQEKCISPTSNECKPSPSRPIRIQSNPREIPDNQKSQRSSVCNKNPFKSRWDTKEQVVEVQDDGELVSHSCEKKRQEHTTTPMQLKLSPALEPWPSQQEDKEQCSVSSSTRSSSHCLTNLIDPGDLMELDGFENRSERNGMTVQVVHRDDEGTTKRNPSHHQRRKTMWIVRLVSNADGSTTGIGPNQLVAVPAKHLRHFV